MDRMVKLNSDDHHIYSCGQEALRRNEVAFTVNKSTKYILGCNLKNERMISFLRQTIQHHSNPTLCPNQSRQKSWSWPVLWRPTRTCRTHTKKRCPFHYTGLECKSRKSRDTQNNRQVWCWSTEKWSRAKANRVLSTEHARYSKYPFPTT